jgi:putative addiction module component (TIGR02574 family)
MSKKPMVELEKLGPGERLRPVTEAQRAELRRRLDEYRADPTEPVVTLADIRREFGAD